jgi:hypothetical protein
MIQNSSLYNGMLQNGALQNGTALQNVCGSKWYITK